MRVLEETGCSSASCKIAGSDMLVSNTDGDEIGLVVLVSRSGAGDRGDGDRGWLVGCFGFNGPLRQYFSLYRAVSQREGERGEKGQMREKMSKQPPPAPTASATGPCPTIIQISRTPRHWKITQHLRSTRPPQMETEDWLLCYILEIAERLVALAVFSRVL